MAGWKKVLTSADIATDDSTGVADSETGLVTGNAVYDYIAAQGFGTGAGDIESVVVTADDSNTVGAANGNADFAIAGGTGISTSASSSTLTVALDYAGTDNFIDSATNLEGTTIASGDTIVYHDAGDNNVKKGLVSDLPFTNNSGTVTSVEGGAYLTGGTITTSGTLAVDAASTNTASKVVARDASGNFSAGTITASLSGNATTATSASSATNATNATNVGTAAVTSGAYKLALVPGSGGNEAVKYDSGLSWNAATDTLSVDNLIVAGTTTTVNSTDLVVADKTIVIADGSADAAAASGAGITVDVGSTAADMPELLWTNGGKLTGWSLADYTFGGSTNFPVSVMEFGTAAPSSPAIETEAGEGAFFFDSTNDTLYVFTG